MAPSEASPYRAGLRGRSPRSNAVMLVLLVLVALASGPAGGAAPALLVAIGDVTATTAVVWARLRSEEHTSELQSQSNLVCRLLLEKKRNTCGRRAGSRAGPFRTPTGTQGLRSRRLRARRGSNRTTELRGSTPSLARRRRLAGLFLW